MNIRNPSDLRRLRQTLGHSQESFATWLGYSRRTIQRWEKG